MPPITSAAISAVNATQRRTPITLPLILNLLFDFNLGLHRPYDKLE
jgi:hypothetical protein